MTKLAMRVVKEYDIKADALPQRLTIVGGKTMTVQQLLDRLKDMLTERPDIATYEVWCGDGVTSCNDYPHSEAQVDDDEKRVTLI